MQDQPTPSLPGILVRKYGGSSLATVDRICTVARDIRLARDHGNLVVVVVSAMGQTTDELAALARQVNPSPPRREMDMLLSVGERITMSLLSMALATEDCPAISFTGSQCGIITDTSHTDARILEVKGDRVREALTEGYCVIVAGFQGVSRAREITTLGRGGSDTTAVALAAALGASRCEILKDVDGVLTADPAAVAQARKHQHLSWDQMKQIAAAGCGVVDIRAVEYASRHRIPLLVRSSFHDEPGTLIGDLADQPDLEVERRPQVSAPRPVSPEPAAELRYRPLVMNVVDQVSRVRLALDDEILGSQARDQVLARLDPCLTLAEWMDVGQGFRWEALTTDQGLDELGRSLLDGMGIPPAALDIQAGFTCLSLAGGRPESWLQVEKKVTGLLRELGCRDWRLRADGSALRILFRGPQPADYLPRLHQELFAD